MKGVLEGADEGDIRKQQKILWFIVFPG